MCFAYAAVLPGMALVAADTACNDPSGTKPYGGKVRRVDGGWVTGTGSAAVCLRGWRALEKAGVRDMAAARSAVVAARDYAVTTYGGLDRQQVEITRFFVARDATQPFSISRINSDASGNDIAPVDPRDFRYQLTFFGMEPFEAETKAAVAAAAQEAGFNGPAHIRAVGRILDFALQHGNGMTREIEIGFSTVEGGRPVPRHIRAPLDWLLSATDAQIIRAAGRPPKPFGPYPDHPVERGWASLPQNRTIAA